MFKDSGYNVLQTKLSIYLLKNVLYIHLHEELPFIIKNLIIFMDKWKRSL